MTTRKYSLQIKMTFVFILFVFYTGMAQLSNDPNEGSFSFGLTLNYTYLQNTSMNEDDPLRSYKPYFGVGVDVMRNAYEKGEMRYYWNMKAITSDAINRILRYTDNQSTVHVELSGIFWAKLGANIYANKNFCIGIGASFADYIVDIPKFKPYFGVPRTDIKYEEPSGWNFTAGPSLFLDFSLGQFILNSNSAYNFGFYRHMINKDYENSVDKIDNYKLPHFINTVLQLRHTGSGFYLSFEYVKMLDKGVVGSNLSRKEIVIGWIVDIDVIKFWK